jgi:hypothetical protein
VVVVPDYRLCPQVSLYDGPITDARSCLAWTRNHLPHALEDVGVKADPTHIAAFGHSAGATLALHLVSPSCRFHSAIDSPKIDEDVKYGRNNVNPLIPSPGRRNNPTLSNPKFLLQFRIQ